MSHFRTALLAALIGTAATTTLYVAWNLDRDAEIPLEAGGTSIAASLSVQPTATPPPPWLGSIVAAPVRLDGSTGIGLFGIGRDDPPRRLLAGFEDIGGVAWSPDGRSLAFAGRRQGNWDIYVIARDGTGLQRVTEHAAYEDWPAWSPDGRGLAFSSYRAGGLDVYRVSLRDDATGEAMRLTEGPGPSIEPAWSPDGHWIVFASWNDGSYRLEAVTSSGEDRQIVVDNADGVDLRAPEWTCDGRRIAYLENRHGSGRLVERRWRSDAAVVSPDAGPRTSVARASGIRSFSQFPDSDAVAVTVDERSGQRLYVADRSGYARSDVGLLAIVPGDLSWTTGPMPVGLAGLSDGAADSERVTASSGALGDPGVTAAPEGPAPSSALVGSELASARTGLGSASRESTQSVMPRAPDDERDEGLAGNGDLRPGFVALRDVRVSGARIHAELANDFAALRAEVRAGVGADFLGTLSDLWRPLGYGGSSFFSWHKTGRAFDTQMEFRGAGGQRNMVLVREEIRGRTMWRMYLRAAAQDGSVGRPLVEPGWSFSAGSGDTESTTEGGRRGRNVPGGYWFDFTAVAQRYGWNRIPSIQRGGRDWRSDWASIEYWHYERRDGLRWFEAARQVYSDDELMTELRADRLRERGVSLRRLSYLGFPSSWLSEG